MNSYKRLEKEYIDLSLQSKDFKINNEFSLQTLLDRYNSHSDAEINLDIARDYLYFLDESYKIKEYKRPKVEKDCSEIINPYKSWY